LPAEHCPREKKKKKMFLELDKKKKKRIKNPQAKEMMNK
jgi:hypothetical protein